MISAVVLTHNDETTLSRCLASISWCDEVVVIDDDSTDGTVAIVKKFEAKVFVHPLHDDFAAQRNFGLSKANGDWVLFVDSDEVVTEELRDEIRQRLDPRLRGDDNSCSGYSLGRTDYWGGRWLTHGETESVKLLRFARKAAGKWSQPVHEEWKIPGKTGELSNPLLHYPHQNVAQFLEEINRYSSVYAQYLFNHGVIEPEWQIVGKPLAKFFVNYLLRLGFLDGTAGIVVALMMSFHSFLVRGKLWQLYDVKKKNIL